MDTGRLPAEIVRRLFNKRHKFKPPAQVTKWNIMKGDRVQVIGNHPEYGKQGIVRELLKDQDRVIVEGVNMRIRHIKGNVERAIPSTKLKMESAIHYSKLSLIDPVNNLPTRINIKYQEPDGKRVRVAKRSGAVIPTPVQYELTTPSSIITESDTLDEDAWKITYDPKKKSAGPSLEEDLTS